MESFEPMKIKQSLSVLFGETEVIAVFADINKKPRLERVAALSEIETVLRPNHTHFCVSGLTSTNMNFKEFGGVGSMRSKKNVLNARTFLFESDSLPIDLQLQLLPELARVFPIALAVHSGRKSLHLYASSSECLDLGKPGSKELVANYKRIWKGLAGIAEAFVKTWLTEQQLPVPKKIFDSSCGEPARLGRLPFAVRQDLGTVQKVLTFEGARKFTAQFVQQFCLAPPIAEMSQPRTSEIGSPVVHRPDMTVEKFERLLKSQASLLPLQRKLQFPELWIQPSGNYLKIFSLTYWAIDKTGCPIETFLEYFLPYLEPACKEVGYKSDPLLGVYDAFNDSKKKLVDIKNQTPKGTEK